MSVAGFVIQLVNAHFSLKIKKYIYMFVGVDMNCEAMNGNPACVGSVRAE